MKPLLFGKVASHIQVIFSIWMLPPRPEPSPLFRCCPWRARHSDGIIAHGLHRSCVLLFANMVGVTNTEAALYLAPDCSLHLLTSTSTSVGSRHKTIIISAAIGRHRKMAGKLIFPSFSLQCRRQRHFPPFSLQFLSPNNIRSTIST